MAIPVVVPKLGEIMESGVLSLWLKNEGERVAKGDALFEMETDKAVATVDANADGYFHRIVSEGTEVEVGGLVAELYSDPLQ